MTTETKQRDYTMTNSEPGSVYEWLNKKATSTWHDRPGVPVSEMIQAVATVAEEKDLSEEISGALYDLAEAAYQEEQLKEEG